MIIPSRWLRQWLIFTHLKVVLFLKVVVQCSLLCQTGKEPSKIPMMSLLVRDSKYPGGLRPNRSLLPPNTDEESEVSPGHYRLALHAVNIYMSTRCHFLSFW